MRTVLITAFPRDWDSNEILDFLKRRGCEVTLRYFEHPPTEDELIELLKGVDGVIAGSHPFTRRVLYSADKLKVISRTGAGFDTIDLEAATERGIIVTTTPEANSESVRFAHRRLRLMARNPAEMGVSQATTLASSMSGYTICADLTGILWIWRRNRRSYLN